MGNKLLLTGCSCCSNVCLFYSIGMFLLKQPSCLWYLKRPGFETLPSGFLRDVPGRWWCQMPTPFAREEISVWGFTWIDHPLLLDCMRFRWDRRMVGGGVTTSIGVNTKPLILDGFDWTADQFQHINAYYGHCQNFLFGHRSNVLMILVCNDPTSRWIGFEFSFPIQLLTWIRFTLHWTFIQT